MKQIALKLHRLNADALITLAGDIHTKMLGNAAIFTAPPIEMEDFKIQVDALREAQEKTLMGGKAAVIVRNEKRRVLEETLKMLANYVANVSRGKEEIIAAAGMPVKRRGPLRYETLSDPIDVRTESLYSEAVSLRWKKVSNAKSYEVEYCPDPIIQDKWQKAPIISAARTVINGLQRKEEYWFRVRALGSQGIVSNWSSPVKQLVS